MAKCPTKSKHSFVAIGRNASGDFLSRPDHVHLPVAARPSPVTQPRVHWSSGRCAAGAVASRFSARHPPTRHPRRDARRDRRCDRWCRCRAGSDKAVAPLSTDGALRLWTGLVSRISDDSPWCRRRGRRCFAWRSGGLDAVIPILVVIGRAEGCAEPGNRFSMRAPEKGKSRCSASNARSDLRVQSRLRRSNDAFGPIVRFDTRPWQAQPDLTEFWFRCGEWYAQMACIVRGRRRYVLVPRRLPREPNHDRYYPRRPAVLFRADKWTDREDDVDIAASDDRRIEVRNDAPNQRVVVLRKVPLE